MSISNYIVHKVVSHTLVYYLPCLMFQTIIPSQSNLVVLICKTSMLGNTGTRRHPQAEPVVAYPTNTEIKQLNRYKGSGGNEKLPPRRIPTVGIVRKVPSTRTQLSHKHHHPGGAVCRSYGVVTLDTPDPTRLTSFEGVGQGRIRWDWYKTIK